ncbi:MAG: 50S ribosomal protein L11 methyltransferase [Bacteroidota bacterium]
MDYIELNCRVNPVDPFVEIVIARLSEIGYEMFEETEDGVKAYIGASLFTDEYRNAFDDLKDTVTITFEDQLIPYQNWNAVWESNFEPVILADQVYIHALFHPVRPEFKYSIVIQPKMAFGTGHHATTSLVMEQMLKMDFKGKLVMDMGCGTGILAILAKMLGATEITAVDNDPIAAENAKENCSSNNAEMIHVMHGDASAFELNKFDVILANINRNILLADMTTYVNGLKSNGFLLMSGFYTDDIPMLAATALSLDLSEVSRTEKDKWCCLVYRKNN